MQGTRHRVRPVVAEEHGIAFDRRDIEVHIGEHRGAALGGRVEVAHERGHALPAALQNTRRPGLRRVEIVVVRLVLGPGAVAQDLQALAIFQRPVEQGGHARFNPCTNRVLAAAKEHALAGARLIHLAGAGDGLNRLGAHQAFARQRNHLVALIVSQEPAEDDHPWVAQARQHAHLAVPGPQRGARLAGHRLGHDAGRGNACRLSLVAEKTAQGFFQRHQRHVFIPAAGQHGLEHGFGRLPGRGLLDDPAAQFGGDGLIAHARNFAGSAVAWRRRANAHGLALCGFTRHGDETPGGLAPTPRHRSHSLRAQTSSGPWAWPAAP